MSHAAMQQNLNNDWNQEWNETEICFWSKVCDTATELIFYVLQKQLKLLQLIDEEEEQLCGFILAFMSLGTAWTNVSEGFILAA